eukprot:CAMPEP_0185703602 /NCGR_PEP_ID=MMETSP1164-20130828/15005_1 /TAXON_ID=1104430 /ORGANISM="Chrysoreinhardia sp, Strain CCMP2950" /LENGTH=276 /DNA_ID=CAMNT_0028370897 /DNA_START=59 /DNA_END=886 /DNA_ORIENTATION=-
MAEGRLVVEELGKPRADQPQLPDSKQHLTSSTEKLFQKMRLQSAPGAGSPAAPGVSSSSSKGGAASTSSSSSSSAEETPSDAGSPGETTTSDVESSDAAPAADAGATTSSNALLDEGTTARVQGPTTTTTTPAEDDDDEASAIVDALRAEMALEIEDMRKESAAALAAEREARVALSRRVYELAHEIAEEKCLREEEGRRIATLESKLSRYEMQLNGKALGAASRPATPAGAPSTNGHAVGLASSGGASEQNGAMVGPPPPPPPPNGESPPPPPPG